jgi:hypothetical protein
LRFEICREPTACWEGEPVGRDRLWVKWHVSIVEVAEVSRALSTVTSDLKSVPIGDTNIPATRLGTKK